MAQLIIDIPDAVAVDVNNTLADYFGWTVESGLTKAQFNKQKIAQYLKQLYISHKASLAADLAKQTEETNLDGVAIS